MTRTQTVKEIMGVLPANYIKGQRVLRLRVAFYFEGVNVCIIRAFFS